MNGTQYSEVWVETHDGAFLCALINGEYGTLMYLRESGDAGFTSRNPAYVGPEAAMLDYRLDNGQVDEYPLEWALPVAQVREAIEYFQREQRPPPFIVWHDDSGDKLSIASP